MKACVGTIIQNTDRIGNQAVLLPKKTILDLE